MSIASAARARRRWRDEYGYRRAKTVGGLGLFPYLDVVMSPSPDVVQDFVDADIDAIRVGVTRGVDRAGRTLKLRWRRQIMAAGLGRRLANTIRQRTWPDPAVASSMNAAASVWTNAPKVIAAHDAGVTIRARSRLFLAIPLEAAGRDVGGKRWTPMEWARRNGVELRPVKMRNGTIMLVADGARLTRGKRNPGIAKKKRGRRRKSDGILTGETTVPVFLLVPQVRLPKRLDLDADAMAVSAMVTAFVSRAIAQAEREMA